MKITCPHCQYGRDVNLRPSPPRTVNATCPKCRQQFTLEVGRPEIPPVKEVPTESVSETPGAALTPPLPEQGPPEPPEPPQRPGTASVIPAVLPKRWDQAHRISYKGKGRTLIGIYMLNSLLTLLTLSIYRFWGKTKVRKYLLGSTELMGERFAYTGTGKELFVGWLKAVGLMIVLFLGPNLLARFVHPGFGLAVMPILMVIIPLAMVSSRRYRLSRTMWHGVRFSFNGQIKDYIKLYVKGSLLRLVTLGLYSPYFHVQKEEFWRTNSYYGSGAFKYTGEGRDLRWYFIKSMLLTVPTLGLCWFWYSAKEARYDWENTSFGGLSFSSDVTGRRMLGFHAGNLLILVVTLGFGLPLVMARRIKFLSEHLSLKGAIEFEKLTQVEQLASAVGDGLVGIFDMDFGI